MSSVLPILIALAAAPLLLALTRHHPRVMGVLAVLACVLPLALPTTFPLLRAAMATLTGLLLVKSLQWLAGHEQPRGYFDMLLFLTIPAVVRWEQPRTPDLPRARRNLSFGLLQLAGMLALLELGRRIPAGQLIVLPITMVGIYLALAGVFNLLVVPLSLRGLAHDDPFDHPYLAGTPLHRIDKGVGLDQRRDVTGARKIVYPGVGVDRAQVRAIGGADDPIIVRFDDQHTSAGMGVALVGGGEVAATFGHALVLPEQRGGRFFPRQQPVDGLEHARVLADLALAQRLERVHDALARHASETRRRHPFPESEPEPEQPGVLRAQCEAVRQDQIAHQIRIAVAQTLRDPGAIGETEDIAVRDAVAAELRGNCIDQCRHGGERRVFDHAHRPSAPQALEQLGWRRQHRARQDHQWMHADQSPGNRVIVYVSTPQLATR